MNTYIQNKLDEFKKKYPDMKSENNEYTAIQTVDFIEEYLTDYHNHIVEKIESEFDENTWTEQDGIRYDTMLANRKLQKILSILQDTNSKE